MIGEIDPNGEAEHYENEMLRLSKSKNWNVHDKGNAEIQSDNGFENFLFKVAEYTNEDLQEITVYRFQSLLDYIKEKNSTQ